MLTKTGPGVNLSYAYSGCTTSITDHIMGTTSSKTVDAINNIVSSTDAGGTIEYKYSSSGMPKKITDNAGNTTVLTYDNFGRKKTMNEPDAGIITYTYNTLGELLSQNSSKGTINFTYDNFGRLLTQNDTEGTTTYTYDTHPHGFGLLASVSSTNGYSMVFAYDNLNRPVAQTETIDGTPYTMSNTYNNAGKINSITYPNNYTINYVYKPDNGNLYQVKKANNTILWSLGSTNNFGQPMEVFLGNNLTTTYNYNNLGMVENINTEGEQDILVQSLAYTYNPRFQLQSRTDMKHNIGESFTYDDLNRLVTSQVSGQAPITIVYNPNGNGNITSKTHIGNYSYNGVQPHAVTGVTNPDGLISTQPQVISYTSFNKVSEINENNNEKNLLITYGAGKQRIKTVLKNNGVLQKTKYFAFAGSYEKIIDHSTGNVRELCYLPGLKGYAAIYETNSIDQTQKLYYVHQDRQGSIQSITNEAGGLEEELNFDAWGNRRNANDWSFNNIPTSFMFDRGYTGHEQLDVFGLINMNGRMYDPKLGRILSPDILVSDAGNTQSYNRYSYCNNNPLMFTDPDGYHPRPSESGDYNSCYGGVLNWGNSLGGKNNSHLFSNGTDFSSFCNAGGDENFGEWTGEPEQATETSSTSDNKDYEWHTIIVNGVEIPNCLPETIILPETEKARADNVNGNNNTTTSGGDGNSLLTGMNWANNGVNAAAYGAYKVGGSAGMLGSGVIKYYANAWKGNQYVKTLNLTKVGSGVGVGTSIAGAIIGSYYFYGSDQSWGDYGQLGVSYLSAGLTFFPATTPLGIGIGVTDAAGGFNSIYDCLDGQQQIYNNTGLVFIPNNVGGFHIIKLK